MNNTTQQTFAVHFDQKFVGTFESHSDAMKVINDAACVFERIAVVGSASDTVEVYIGRGRRGVVNYAYATVTISQH